MVKKSEVTEWPGQKLGRRSGKIIQPGDGDPRHGTVNGYCNLQCGRQSDGSPRRACMPCKEAWREKHLHYMQTHPEQYERHAEYERNKREKKRQQFGVPYEQLHRS